MSPTLRMTSRDLAGHDPDGRHAAARREAEPFRLRSRVADQRRPSPSRDRGEDRAVVDRRAPARPTTSPRYTITSPARSNTESMKAPRLLTRPVARARVPSNMSKTPPRKMTRPPASHSCPATRTAPTTVIANPIRVSASGVRPSRPMAERDRLEGLLDPRPGVVRDRHGHPANPRMARSRAANSANASAASRQMVSRPFRRRLDHACGAQAADMPRDQRLRQPDVVDQLGHGRVAGHEPAHDPEPVDVGHGLVEDAQLAQVLGRRDGRRNGAANAGSGGGQVGDSAAGPSIASTTVYINGR